MKQYIKLIENVQKDLYPIILGENITEDLYSLIENYINDNKHVIEYSFKRDNCGVVSKDFSLYAQKNGFDINHIEGIFKVENLPSLSKKDLTQDEYKKFIEDGYNINNQDDIKEFAIKENFYDELFEIPHYWNSFENTIIDFSAKKQFLENNLVSTINKDNYVKK